jgi:hypothetical protein
VNEVEGASLLGGQARTLWVDGEPVDEAIVTDLGSDWIEIQAPDKRAGLSDTDGPRPVRKIKRSLDEVELTPPTPPDPDSNPDSRAERER